MVRLARCVLMACVASVLVLSGCAAWAGTQRATVVLNYPHAMGESLTQSTHERYHTIASIAAHDTRALVDDLDVLFQTDRPTRLTRWHDR
ncbi:MAG: hypothetical protein WBE26_11750 [Phycisphaerae bacterium]